MAVISILKIIIKLSQSNKISDLVKNFDFSDKIKANILNIGFGLHIGWAVEGAIGSTFKIDISYLGENINITSKLKELTKYYGVEVILRFILLKF